MLHVALSDEHVDKLDAIVEARREWAAEHGLRMSRSAVIRLLINREYAAIQRKDWTP